MPLLGLVGLYWISQMNFLLFHSVAEFFSILVAAGIFIVYWNSRTFYENNYLSFLSISYFFIALIDIIHTLAYKGMGVFPKFDANLPTQLWIVARYLESISLLIAPLFFSHKIKPERVLHSFAILVAIALGTIFYWRIFPVCYIEGIGLTRFKVFSEYLISLILLLAIAHLVRKRGLFSTSVFRDLVAAISVSIGAELAFTVYTDVYGLSNFIGHILKIVSYYLVYRALLETGLSQPQELLFNNLKRSEQRYRTLFENNLAAVYRTSLDGEIQDCNPAFAQIFGYTSATDAIGTSANQLYSYARDRDKFISLLTRNDAVRNIESRLQTIHGVELMALENANLISDPQTGCDIIQGTIIDITTQKREQHLQEASRLIAQAALRNTQLEDLYLEIHAIIRKVMIADNFYIALFDPVEDLIRFPYFIDQKESSVESYKPGKGLTEYVLRTSRSLLYNQSHHDEFKGQGLVEAVGPPSHSWLGVPLIIDQETIGVMVIQNYVDAQAYGLREQHMLEFVSEMVAIAIAKVKLHLATELHVRAMETRVAERTRGLQERIDQIQQLNGALTNLMADLRANQNVLEASQVELEEAHRMLQQERIKEQATLLNLSQALLPENDNQTILKKALQEAVQALQVDFAAIILMDEDGLHYSAQAIFGWPAELVEQAQFVPIDDQTDLGAAILTKAPMITPDIFNSRFKNPQAILQMGIQSSLIVPMLVADNALGALVLDSTKKRNWDDDEVRLLSLIANTTAQALERATLFHQVQRGRERLGNLSRRLVEVQENERHVIARELHDQVGQSMTALKLHLQMIAHSVSEDALSIALDEGIQMAERAMQRVRNLSRDLRPSVLDDFGLEPALRWHLDHQAQWGGFQWNFESELTEVRLPSDIEIVCYRIAQAALNNIVQHAKAKQVHLKIWVEAESLQMVIEDNGVGFDLPKAMDQAAHSQTLGLLSMLERAELMGGMVTINSTPKQGTSIQMRLPIDMSKALERRGGAREMP